MARKNKPLTDFFEKKERERYQLKELEKKTQPKSRDELIERLRELKEIGWIQTREQINDGLVGNTLEDYLGVEENNLSLPDVGRFELKSQRLATSSMTTLLHFDPYPRKPKTVVMHYLGPIYGWPHETRKGEWSFRVTMYGNRYTNRGFRIAIDEELDRLVVIFNPKEVDPSLNEWLETALKLSKGQFNPQPYWNLNDIEKRVKKKLPNMIYVHFQSRKGEEWEEFKFDEAVLYENLSFERIKQGLRDGEVLVDFDACTSHNHGTKFRIKKGTADLFYDNIEKIY